jgi:hypothetical protein
MPFCPDVNIGSSPHTCFVCVYSAVLQMASCLLRSVVRNRYHTTSKCEIASTRLLATANQPRLSHQLASCPRGTPTYLFVVWIRTTWPVQSLHLRTKSWACQPTLPSSRCCTRHSYAFRGPQTTNLHTQVKDAFRQLSKVHHPDLCRPEHRASAEVTYKDITAAYEALLKRRAFTFRLDRSCAR